MDDQVPVHIHDLLLLAASAWEGNHHAPESVTHIFQAGRQRKDRHDLGSNGDIVSRAVFEAGFVLAKCPVVKFGRVCAFDSRVRRTMVSAFR